MSRDLGTDLAEAVADRVVRPFLAVHIDFPDPVFGWTGTGLIQFDGETWTGIAGVASIDTIGEGTDGSATGVSVTLNAVPAEFASHVYDQGVRGCDYRLFVGALDETWQQVVGYKLAWRGTLQSYRISDGGETLTVTAGGESRMLDQRRPAIKRFTLEYQMRKFSGDKFFEYAAALTEVPILWAKAEQTGASPVRSGASGGSNGGNSVV